MPRLQKRGLRARAATPEPAGQPSLEVAARPTDPYGPEYSPGTADLLRGISAITEKAVPAAIQAGEYWGKKQEEKGAVARQRGEAPKEPGLLSDRWLQGYAKMDGEYQGLEYQNAVGKWVAENGHLPPDEFEAGVTSLQREYLGRLTDDRQIETFGPAALKADTYAARAYQEIQAKQLAVERNAKITSVFRARSADIINTGLQDLEIARSMEDMMTDPDVRNSYLARRTEFAAAVGPKMRALLDEKRAEYKELGLSTIQISKALFDLTGDAAVQYGMPELLSYAFIKDVSGIAPGDRFSKEADDYLRRAIASRDSISDHLYTVRERERKESQRKIVNNMTLNALLLDPMDVRGAQAGLATLSTQRDVMDDAEFRSLTKLYTDILHNRGRREVSDSATVQRLALLEAKNLLSVQDLEASYTMLNDTDVKYFATKLHETETSGTTPAEREVAHLVTIAESQIKQRLRGTPIKGAPPEFVTPQAGRAITSGLIMFTNLFKGKVKERGGKGAVTEGDVFDIIEKVIGTYEKYSKISDKDFEASQRPPSPIPLPSAR